VTTLVSLERIVKGYTRGNSKVEVLRGLSLEIEAGEFVALMGPSGSGKTTLLNLIGGLDRSDAGSVVVDGQHLEKMSNDDLARWRGRHVGFIFQFYNLLPMLTAQANVELPLLLTKLSRTERRRRAETALELVDLGARASHRPAELSGGQQRVAIARALVADPAILVCDEPTGDLDRSTAADILQLMQSLNKMHRKTIIMVTHDPRAAAAASRTIHLDKGELASADTVGWASDSVTVHAPNALSEQGAVIA